MPLAVSAPVDWLPEVNLAPDQPPEAVQDVVFVEDQVSVEDAPLATDVGFAASDTVGKGSWLPWTASPLWLTSPAVQAPTARASTATSSKVFARNISFKMTTPRLLWL